MTRFAALLVWLAFLAPAPSLAQQLPLPDEGPAPKSDAPARDADSPAPPPDAPAPPQLSDLTLDELFAELPKKAGSRAGRRIEQEILARFNKSGSDTADLLVSWATKSMEDKNYPLALDILDQAIMLKPDFAEAWNKRATVYYLIDDYSASIADIRQTLALEPRHFGALSGLGMIFQAMDRDEEAVEVFRRVLEINPQLDKIKESLERLEKELAQNAI
jgi:tetratricopeptide (TPR) repeat protein